MGALLYGAAAAPTDPEIGSPVVELLLALGFLAFAIVGAVVAWKRPSNPIGWLLLATGFVMCTGFVGASAYTAHEPALPGRVYVMWYTHITAQSPGIFTFFAFFLLLFPNGRLPTPRWRHLARFSVASTTLFLLLLAFGPGELAESKPPTQNPLAVGWVGPISKIVELPLFFAVMSCIPAASVSFVLRFRRSRGDERQQLKWFAWSAVLLGMAITVAPILFITDPQTVPWLWPVMFFVATTSVPVAAGIAVMRYRLYDIDRIISRTLSYAVITIVLAAVYLGIVVGLQRVLQPLTGGRDLAIAGSTLVVAAAFGPVRRRVQSAVDRRFNRARYDAARTIEAFATRLREQVDIDALGAELTDIVHRTMEPDNASLWLVSGRQR